MSIDCSNVITTVTMTPDLALSSPDGLSILCYSPIAVAKNSHDGAPLLTCSIMLLMMPATGLIQLFIGGRGYITKAEIIKSCSFERISHAKAEMTAHSREWS